MTKINRDDILSFWEMCEAENVRNLQRGINFRLSPNYSVILMSRRSNAPYNDKLHSDGETIEYEGHNVSRKSCAQDPKLVDQSERLSSGRLTQNGMFVKAVESISSGREPELVKVYEKVLSGVWSLKGFFDLVGVDKVSDGKRMVYKFLLKLSNKNENSIPVGQHNNHVRLIPSQVKKDVWKRDGGKCVICGDDKNLHFDHDLPYSKGGTSLSVKNVRLLCMKHNLEKSAKIE